MIFSKTVSFHVFKTPNVFFTIFVNQWPVGSIVVVKGPLKVIAFLINKLALSVFLQIFVKASFIQVSIKVLDDDLANDLFIFPKGF
jgi:hypothetical protein